jgi:hypothetical protein
MSYRISEIWAFTTVGDDDEEGIIPFVSRMGVLPMIAADDVRLTQLTPLAQDFANQTKRAVRLVKFSTLTEVKRLVPQ